MELRMKQYVVYRLIEIKVASLFDENSGRVDVDGSASEERLSLMNGV